MLCSVQFGSVNSKAVELCCDETRFGEVGRGMAVQVRSVKAWSGLSSSGWARRSGHVMVGRGSARRSNYNSH